MPAAQDQSGVSESQEKEFFSSKGNIITIHPGSKYLRIGRASDLKPFTVLQAVARLRSPDAPRHEDSILVPDVKLTRNLLSEIENTCIEICGLLQSCIQSNGARRVLTPYTQVAFVNRGKQQPEVLDKSSLRWIESSSPSECIVGEKIMYLKPREAYDIHFPFRRGELNLHPGVGGSLFSVVNDIEVIWTYALEHVLGIPKTELGKYKAVLIIPDTYNRQHLKELTNILLLSLGFGSCFLIQDHVCATAGAGIATACVIDIGDQKTSVSCIDECVSIKQSRIKIDYGGADITHAFFWLLRRSAFPLKPCIPRDPVDGMLLSQLKEKYCHLDLDVSGMKEASVLVDRPDSARRHYSFKVADERIIAPLGLFFPTLFLLSERTGGTKGQSRYQHQPEDPQDVLYLRETGRRGKREADGGDDVQDEEDIIAEVDEIMGGSDFQSESLLPLDLAVLQSIEKASENLSEEIVKRLYANILVVGGSAKMEGLSTWLQNRISMRIPLQYRGEPVEVVTKPKDQDPENTSWKGANLIACMEAAQELWIRPKEWKRYSVKILRERAPFVW